MATAVEAMCADSRARQIPARRAFSASAHGLDDIHSMRLNKDPRPIGAFGK